MRVLVTRPQPQAGEWQQALVRAGFEAEALPLLQLGPLTDTGPLRVAWSHIGGYHAAMFVSAAAVQHFFAAFPAVGQAASVWAAIKTRAWGTGPGTGSALRRCGVADDRIDIPPADAGQFDSEALWRVVQPQLTPGQAVLILRGAHEGDAAGGSGRDWLSAQLRTAGVHVDVCATYQRGPTPPQPAMVSRARQAASDGSVWLFASSEAVGTLRLWCPAQDWSQGRAIATHPRIAASAAALGFGQVAQSRPDTESVAQTLRSLH